MLLIFVNTASNIVDLFFRTLSLKLSFKIRRLRKNKMARKLANPTEKRY